MPVLNRSTVSRRGSGSDEKSWGENVMPSHETLKLKISFSEKSKSAATNTTCISSSSL